MKSSTPTLPLVAIFVFLAALFLLDFAFDSTFEVLAAFMPVLLWAGIVVARGRG